MIFFAPFFGALVDMIARLTVLDTADLRGASTYAAANPGRTVVRFERGLISSPIREEHQGATEEELDRIGG